MRRRSVRTKCSARRDIATANTPKLRATRPHQSRPMSWARGGKKKTEERQVCKGVNTAKSHRSTGHVWCSCVRPCYACLPRQVARTRRNKHGRAAECREAAGQGRATSGISSNQTRKHAFRCGAKPLPRSCGPRVAHLWLSSQSLLCVENPSRSEIVQALGVAPRHRQVASTCPAACWPHRGLC